MSLGEGDHFIQLRDFSAAQFRRIELKVCPFYAHRLVFQQSLPGFAGDWDWDWDWGRGRSRGRSCHRSRSNWCGNIRLIKIIIYAEGQIVVVQLGCAALASVVCPFTGNAPVWREFIFNTQTEMRPTPANGRSISIATSIDTRISQFCIRQPITVRQAQLEIQPINMATVIHGGWSRQNTGMGLFFVKVHEAIHAQQHAVHIPVISALNTCRER